MAVRGRRGGNDKQGEKRNQAMATTKTVKVTRGVGQAFSLVMPDGKKIKVVVDLSLIHI